ncbi:MAG TPA: redoxin domain-containing protein, partial [Gemmataceae bacterium]|nr:redoxin domain-containing protein [Gemmataceae bacterium]
MKRVSLPLSLFVLALLTGQARPDAPMVTDKLNKKIDNFTLTDSTGKTFSLHDLKEPKAVVLTFLSFDCPVSNSYAQPLADLHRTFAKKGVAFVGIAFTGKDELARHVKDFGLPFPVLSDRELVVADLCK